MRRGSLLAIIAVAAAREKPTSRSARRARKAWLNGTKPPTLNTFYFYVDRDDPRNTTVPSSITTMIARAQRDARRWGVDIRAEVHGFASGRELVRQEGQKNLLHALAAALRRVAPHGSEHYRVLAVLEKTRDGRRARIAWARLVSQRNTIKHSTLEGASRL